MATFDGKFIRGVAGNLTFRKQGNKQIVQVKTGKINMTAESFDAAYIFGRASTLASYIRMSTSRIIRYYDRGMIPRFTGQCNQILQLASTDKDGVFDFSQDYFSRLNGFEFHLQSPVKNHLFVQPMVNLTEEKITIDIPEIQIPKELKFPTNARYCTVVFNVSFFDFEHNQYKNLELQSFEVEQEYKTLKFPAQQLEFESVPGALAIITVGLYYSEKTFVGKVILNNNEFCPVAILKAEFCPGEMLKQEHWREMEFNDKKKRKKLKKTKKITDGIV